MLRCKGRDHDGSVAVSLSGRGEKSFVSRGNILAASETASLAEYSLLVSSGELIGSADFFVEAAGCAEITGKAYPRFDYSTERIESALSKSSMGQMWQVRQVVLIFHFSRGAPAKSATSAPTPPLWTTRRLNTLRCLRRRAVCIAQAYSGLR